MADFDLFVGDDDPRHQGFEQLPPLVPGGPLEPFADPPAELLQAQPEARDLGRKASPEHGHRRSEAAERRRNRYPVPEDALPPLDRVLMTHAGCVVFEAVTGELAEPIIAARFYPGVAAGPAALVWAAWRRPSHAELVKAWPARTTPGPADLARGWWRPTIEALREERRRAASLERARVTRRAKAL